MKKALTIITAAVVVNLYAGCHCACVEGCGLCTEIFQTYVPNMKQVYTEFLLQDKQTGILWNELISLREQNKKLEDEYRKEITKLNILTQKINLEDRKINFLLKKIKNLKAIKNTKN
ncbi:hypothetical protein [Caminibacter pacificus]|uniref:Uncharacterized protein n=1 Tax=Caminibacter pacificus TaxID=1424653 RepID=A0AAJ4RAR1_9BACT|nr:hypothetical protein [Caminibacter pacificus]QDD68225.1 hypothetical protein C6V80_10240 [Caminibacter pacificus]ROR38739.1 hypothetical protein EDC58_1954 [Caminibacter pacificus]